MQQKQPGVSRRQFLRAAGAGIGAALVASARIPALAHPTSVQQPHAQRAAQARQGVVRVAWEPVRNLDPAFISNDSEIAFCNAVYDYLIDPTTTDALAPRLAQSWAMSADGLEYTFNLVPGVRFHDGRALTAEDVAWSLNRLRDPQVGSPKVSLYANVREVVAVDDTTLVVRLERTEPDFLYSMTDSSAVVVPAGSTDLAATYIGSGPFRLERFLPEDRAIFVANEDYWIPGLPRLAGMEHLYMDADAAFAALSGGQIDVWLRPSISRFVALQQNPDLQTVSLQTSGHDVLRLRVDREPGNNPDVQRALKMATNRQEINDFAQLGLGATGRDAPIGPYFAEYFNPDSPLPPYDPEGARELLRSAGYPDGLTFDLHVPNTGPRPDFATVIQAQWAQAGITVNIILEDESTYYSDDGWLEVDLGITGWGARPTPQQYLEFSLRSDAPWNETRINDPELDALIDVAGSSLDRAERIQAYRDIQDLLAERGPLVIPYFFPSIGAVRRAFSMEEDGIQLFPGRTDFRRVTLVG